MFHQDIKKLAKENTNFRKVVYTGKESQLVLMNVPKGEEIGEETHHQLDQILFAVDGKGEAIIEGQSSPFVEDEVVFVPTGTKHNFKNTSDEDLKLISVYSPPAHKDGTVHKTREEAEKEESYEKANTLPDDPMENM